MQPNIAWSDFARNRHLPGTGQSYARIAPAILVDLIGLNWNRRIAGHGETGLDRKVVVPLLPLADGLRSNCEGMFFCGHAVTVPGLPVRCRINKRQAHEEPFVEKYITPADAAKFGIEAEPATFVKVVLYSKDALLENGGTRSSDADWEIVALICSAVEVEPMRPLTMARNELELPGGTKSTYSGKQYAEAIVYWSRRIKIIDDVLCPAIG